jgi:hypothetical protein
MYRVIAVGMVLSLAGSVAWADPMFPVIVNHDFSFLGSPATYSYNGESADTLLIPLDDPNDRLAGEVFAYTSPVTPKGSSTPIYDINPPDGFGGDLYLNLAFSRSDGTFVNGSTGQEIDVNLVGTGNNAAGWDLEIWGRLDENGIPGLLLAMEIDQAVLYGYSGGTSYIVEAIGTIQDSIIPELARRIGQSGAVTGSLFFEEIPDLIDPLTAPASDDPIEVAYSGEAGEGIPEPATMLLAAFGGLALFFRRKRR